MSIVSWLFKKQLTKLQEDVMANMQGSDFYKAMLRNVTNMPVYMKADIDSYIKEGYLFNPSVYSIVSFIAQKAGSIPWGVYEVKNDKALSLYKTASSDLPQYKKSIVKTKALVELPSHDLNQLFESPNTLQAWAEFIEQVVGYKLVTGNSYVHCIGPTGGANGGTIKEMWTLPAQIVSIVAGDQINPVKQYELKGSRDVVIPPEEVIHLKYWTPEYAQGRFLYGLSPIRAGRRVVSKSNSSFDAMVASFQNMGVAGILSPDGSIVEELTPEQQEDLESTFKRKTGPKNNGKPLISGIPLKWQQTGMSPVDLAIIESDKMDLRTMCNLFHVPSELFNDAANKTYSNTKEAGSAVYTNAVIPALTQFRDALNQYLRPRYKEKIFIDFDTSMISELQDDISMLTTALQGAWYLTPNERRDMLSFGMDENNPLMDDYWTPAGLFPMSGATMDDAAIEEAAKRLKLNE